ncbi:MAG: glutamate formimidoyltransferase [Actinomycetota bacterium]
MDLIAIPNVSEGRDPSHLERFSAQLTSKGAIVLDVHMDGAHNRAVLTTTGPSASLPGALAALAAAAKLSIDLTRHTGVHPRIGVLDVCPLVPHEGTMASAVATALDTATAIAESASLPVYLYGDAARRDETRELPALRKDGLDGLTRRARAGLLPDFGPSEIDPRHGVVCVGARDALVAFNVWLRGTEEDAKAIAARIRTAAGGPPGIRALGVPMARGRAQVTMNLTAPAVTGIDEAFAVVGSLAADRGIVVDATEIVGLVPRRYLPAADGEAARLLMKPGRSLESKLEGLLAPPS